MKSFTQNTTQVESIKIIGKVIRINNNKPLGLMFLQFSTNTNCYNYSLNSWGSFE